MVHNNIETTQAWAYSLFQPQNLDGDPEFSTDEHIAFWYLLDQYGHPEESELDDLYVEMSDQLQSWHDTLLGVVPRKQIVYIDFSGLEGDYEKNPKNKLSFQDWQPQVIRKLKQIFRNNQRQALNIEFVTVEPKNGEYTTVFLAGKQEGTISPARIFREGSRREKLMIMEWFLSSQKDAPAIFSYVSNVIRDMKNSHPDASEEEILFLAFEHPDIQDITIMYQSTGHQYGSGRDQEFGNQSLNGLISIHYLDWDNLNGMLDPPEYLLRLGLYQYMGYPEKLEDEWYSFSTKGHAESIAHELGHAFGFHHHGQYYYKSCGGIYDRLVDNDVMNGGYDLQFSDDRTVGFNDGATLYLERVLGLKDDS